MAAIASSSQLSGNPVTTTTTISLEKLVNKILSLRLKFRRHYSTAVSTGDIVKSDSARLAPKKKSKTAESPKIMLVSETKHISVVTLEEAQKIAERKTLHLVAGDSKLSKDKPVYKLVTNAEFLASDSDSSRGIYFKIRFVWCKYLSIKL